MRTVGATLRWLLSEVEDLTGSSYGRGRDYLDSGYYIDAPVRDADLKDVEF